MEPTRDVGSRVDGRIIILLVLMLFALPVLTAASIMQLLDRVAHTGFFTPTNLVINQISVEADLGGAGSTTQTSPGATPLSNHPAKSALPIFPQPNRPNPFLAIDERSINFPAACSCAFLDVTKR